MVKKYIDFQEHIAGVETAIEKFKNIFQAQKFYIDCTDGKTITFFMRDNNLPHVLGVSNKQMNYTGRFNGIYQFLLDVINNKHEYDRKLKRQEILWSYLFNAGTDDKVEAFNKLEKFDASSIKFIVKYDPKRDLNDENWNIACDYMIYVSSDNFTEEGAMILCVVDDSGICSPKSLRYIKSKEELIKYINNHQALLPILIDKNNIITKQITSSEVNRDEQKEIKEFLTNECDVEVIDNRINLSEFGGPNKEEIISKELINILRLQKAEIERYKGALDEMQYEIYESNVKRLIK